MSRLLVDLRVPGISKVLTAEVLVDSDGVIDDYIIKLEGLDISVLFYDREVVKEAEDYLCQAVQDTYDFRENRYKEEEEEL